MKQCVVAIERPVPADDRKARPQIVEHARDQSGIARALAKAGNRLVDFMHRPAGIFRCNVQADGKQTEAADRCQPSSPLRISTRSSCTSRAAAWIGGKVVVGKINGSAIDCNGDLTARRDDRFGGTVHNTVDATRSSTSCCAASDPGSRDDHLVGDRCGEPILFVEIGEKTIIDFNKVMTSSALKPMVKGFELPS